MITRHKMCPPFSRHLPSRLSPPSVFQPSTSLPRGPFWDPLPSFRTCHRSSLYCVSGGQPPPSHPCFPSLLHQCRANTNQKSGLRKHWLPTANTGDTDRFVSLSGVVHHLHGSPPSAHRGSTKAPPCRQKGLPGSQVLLTALLPLEFDLSSLLLKRSFSLLLNLLYLCTCCIPYLLLYNKGERLFQLEGLHRYTSYGTDFTLPFASHLFYPLLPTRARGETAS